MILNIYVKIGAQHADMKSVTHDDDDDDDDDDVTRIWKKKKELR